MNAEYIVEMRKVSAKMQKGGQGCKIFAKQEHFKVRLILSSMAPQPQNCFL